MVGLALSLAALAHRAGLRLHQMKQRHPLVMVGAVPRRNDAVSTAASVASGEVAGGLRLGTTVLIRWV